MDNDNKSCTTCKSYQFSNICSGRQKHHICLIEQGKSGIHGGKIIPINKVAKRPEWCPLKKLKQLEV